MYLEGLFRDRDSRGLLSSRGWEDYSATLTGRLPMNRGCQAARRNEYPLGLLEDDGWSGLPCTVARRLPTNCDYQVAGRSSAPSAGWRVLPVEAGCGTRATDQARKGDVSALVQKENSHF